MPEGKRAALLLIVDERGCARAHLAARIGKSGDWKVAAAAESISASGVALPDSWA